MEVLHAVMLKSHAHPKKEKKKETRENAPILVILLF